MTITFITSDTFAGAYHELDTALGERDTRKLQHNTYLRRESSDLIVRYHETDILTYHANSTITLRTDGWHTVTTARRFDCWLPRGWSVSSDNEHWNVFGPVMRGGKVERITSTYNPDYSYPRRAAHHRLWEGMTITDTPRPMVVNFRHAPDFTNVDNLANELRGMIETYADLYTVERLRELFPDSDESISLSGDCWSCSMFDTGGVALGDAHSDHLLSHLCESYTMVSLIRNAYRHRGYGNSDFVMSLGLVEALGLAEARQGRKGPFGIREHIIRFLSARLIPHGIPTVTRDELNYARKEAAA